MINIDDFQKIEMAVGRIISAEALPDSKKLLKLSVDFAEEKPRQVISGIAKYFKDPQELINQKCMFVVNLEPRSIAGYNSEAMILAVSTDENLPDAGVGKFSLITTLPDIPPGTRAK